MLPAARSLGKPYYLRVTGRAGHRDVTVSPVDLPEETVAVL